MRDIGEVLLEEIEMAEMKNPSLKRKMALMAAQIATECGLDKEQVAQIYKVPLRDLK